MKLVLTFGGPKLHYALTHELDLPSIRTTQSSSKPPIIRPCIAFPTAQEITSNWELVHTTHVLWRNGKLPPKHGLSLMIDETAIENRPRYDPDHDAVVGFSCVDASSLALLRKP
jgi:hypothetical protein